MTFSRKAQFATAMRCDLQKDSKRIDSNDKKNNPYIFTHNSYSRCSPWFDGMRFSGKICGFDSVIQDDIEYINSIPITPRTNLSVTLGDEKHQSRQSASYVVPLPPFAYWKSVGKYNNGYGVSRCSMVFPLCSNRRFVMFDHEGKAQSKYADIMTPFLFHYAEVNNYKEDARWQFDLLPIPPLGSLLGFGDDYFRFLFIPFCTPDEKIGLSGTVSFRSNPKKQ